MSGVHEHNARAWNRRVRRGERFTRPAEDGLLNDHGSGANVDPWLGDVRGQRVLCLAAGGGRQSAIYAAAGAIVTVVDISGEMLALDREVAAGRKLDVRTVEASIDDLAPLADAAFDAVVQPVSTCYVVDVAAVYREVARVLDDDGLYISQHKQPASLQAGAQRTSGAWELSQPYYRNGPLPDGGDTPHREGGTLEFLHRWEQLIGGMCRAGFVIEDLVEPHHANPQAAANSFGDRSLYLPPYVRIKARRRGRRDATARKRLWLNNG
mgnify:CR=1 FL=1